MPIVILYSMSVDIIARFFKKLQMCVLKNGGGHEPYKTRIIETNTTQQIPEIFSPKASLWVILEQLIL